MEVVFTGAFDAPGFASMTRPQLCRVATAARFTVKSAVTKRTAYLVAADDSGETAKSRMARRYGVSVISYERFMQTVNERLRALGLHEFVTQETAGAGHGAIGGAGRVGNTFANVPDAGRMAPPEVLLTGRGLRDVVRPVKPIRRTAFGGTGGRRALDI